jgi:hypothetical protein
MAQQGMPAKQRDGCSECGKRGQGTPRPAPREPDAADWETPAIVARDGNRRRSSCRDEGLVSTAQKMSTRFHARPQVSAQQWKCSPRTSEVQLRRTLETGKEEKMQEISRPGVCPENKHDLDLSERSCQSLVAATGGKMRCLARIVTPFILERANPSKDGDAKPWAFSARADGRQVAEGVGRRKARSSPSTYHPVSGRACR